MSKHESEQKRTAHLPTKETYINGKRPAKETRHSLQHTYQQTISKETYIYEKRHTSMKRDLRKNLQKKSLQHTYQQTISKETYINEKRPAKETYKRSHYSTHVPTNDMVAKMNRMPYVYKVAKMNRMPYVYRSFSTRNNHKL